MFNCSDMYISCKKPFRASLIVRIIGRQLQMLSFCVLLQVQFILEAFGNAVTIQNSNSSRFAMYYEVFFSPEYKLSGGKFRSSRFSS